MRSVIYVDGPTLRAAAMASPSTLLPDEIKRWHFNAMMEFKNKPARQPAEIQALYPPILEEAWRLAQEANAEAAALPAGYVSYSREESDAKMRRHEQIQSRAFAQEQHYFKVRQQYSYELAFSIWWNRVDQYNKAIQERQDAYRAAWEKEFADQKAFEVEQADKAIAELRAAQPHLPEALLTKLHTLLTCRLHLYFRRYQRSEAPRRVMRGMPKVLCGSLPSQARLDYSGINRSVIHTAF